MILPKHEFWHMVVFWKTHPVWSVKLGAIWREWKHSGDWKWLASLDYLSDCSICIIPIKAQPWPWSPNPFKHQKRETKDTREVCWHTWDLCLFPSHTHTCLFSLTRGYYSRSRYVLECHSNQKSLTVSCCQTWQRVKNREVLFQMAQTEDFLNIGS